MISLGSPQFRELIEESTRLRTAGDIEAAVDMIEECFRDMEPEAFSIACRHAIHTARQGGLDEVARKLAVELATVAPNDHLVSEILGAAQGGLGEVARARVDGFASVAADAEILARQGGLGEVAHARTTEPGSSRVTDPQDEAKTGHVGKAAGAS
jgi:hypothetical protein